MNEDAQNFLVKKTEVYPKNNNMNKLVLKAMGSGSSIFFKEKYLVKKIYIDRIGSFFSEKLMYF